MIEQQGIWSPGTIPITKHSNGLPIQPTTCGHPDRPYFVNGMCYPCYRDDLNETRRRATLERRIANQKICALPACNEVIPLERHPRSLYHSWQCQRNAAHKRAAKRLKTKPDPQHRPARAPRATREWINDQKNHPCMDCHNRFPPEAMQFDHRPGTNKLFNVASAVSRTIDATLDEIAKCDLVCANCHAVRTATRKRQPTVSR